MDFADREATDREAVERQRAVRRSALSRRRSSKHAPWTMPKSACGESPRASRLRTAQRWVRSIAAAAVAWSAVEAMHSSIAIMMSLPIARWTSMLRSGLSTMRLPST